METPGETGSISVQSTVQLDGDITTLVMPSALSGAVLFSHMAETEKRIRGLARLVRRTARAAHAFVGLSVPIAWFWALSDRLSLADPLATVAIWLGLSVVTVATIEYLLRTPFVQKALLAAIVRTLTRFTTN